MFIQHVRALSHLAYDSNDSTKSFSGVRRMFFIIRISFLSDDNALFSDFAFLFNRLPTRVTRHLHLTTSTKSENKISIWTKSQWSTQTEKTILATSAKRHALFSDYPPKFVR